MSDNEIEYVKSIVTDFSKLRIENGTILYKLYLQDGTFQETKVPDTYSNRLFVSWVQIHDRYTSPQKKG